MSSEESFLSIEDEPTEAPHTGFGLDGKGKIPTMEEIMALIDSTASISDDEKNQIKEDIIKFNKERADGIHDFVQSQAVQSGYITPNVFLFIVVVALVVLIIGLFARKLIMTERMKLREKEMKRQAREERRTKRKKT